MVQNVDVGVDRDAVVVDAAVIVDAAVVALLVDVELPGDVWRCRFRSNRDVVQR